jgi:MFS transporter, DHA1 family, inner membrane transport protein
MKKHELIILFTLAFVQFTHILDAMVMMPMGPNLKDSFHIGTKEFNFLVGSYGIAAFVSAIVATFWMDKFDRKKVLLVLYVGFLIGTFACAMSETYEYLLISRIFTGLFGGVAGAVILSIVGDLIPLERRARGVGVLMSGFALAAVAGVPLGIFLSETYSWHAPFFLVCGIGVFVVAAIAFFIPPVTAHLQPTGQKKQNLYASIIKNPNEVRALLFSFTFVMAHFAVIPNISDFMVNNMHFNMKTEVIWIYVAGGVLSSFSSPLWGKLADKYGRFKMFTILSLLSIIPIFFISNFNSSSLTALIAVTCMFFIFSGGRMIPSSAMVTAAVPPHLRGGFMSLNSALQQLAIGLLSVVSAFVITNDPETHALGNYHFVGYIGIFFTIVAIIIGSGVKVYPDKKPA